VSRKGLRRKEKVIIFIVFPWRAKGELGEEKRELEGMRGFEFAEI